MYLRNVILNSFRTECKNFFEECLEVTLFGVSLGGRLFVILDVEFYSVFGSLRSVKVGREPDHFNTLISDE